MNPVSTWLVRRRLTSPDEETRRQVVRELVDAADPGAIELLGVAIQDAQEEIAKEAVQALAKHRTPEVLELLSVAVRRLLVERTLPGAERKFRYSNRLPTLVLALREFGAAAATVWISVLQNRDAECANDPELSTMGSNYAAELLGEQRYAPAASALIARLDDPGIRGQAARALGVLKHSAAGEKLTSMLSDRDGFVRGNVVWALGEMKYTAAVGPLSALLSDPDASVRREVARALSALSWEPKDPATRAAAAVLADDLRGAVEAGAAAIRPLVAQLLELYVATGKKGGRSSKPAAQVMVDMKVDQLPPLERVKSLVEALEQLFGRSDLAIDPDDLSAVAHLPDFRVRYMAEITRTDHGSGNEYVERVPSDTNVDCSKLRQRATARLGG